MSALKTSLVIFGGIIIGLILLALITALGLGYFPNFSKKVGIGTAKDLGVTYTDDDFSSAVEKISDAVQTQEVDQMFTEAELSALINGCMQAICILDDAQVKTATDGTLELSGTVNRDDLVQLLIDLADKPSDSLSDAAGLVKLMPARPAIYLDTQVAGEQDQITVIVRRASVAGFDLKEQDLDKLSDELNSVINDVVVSPDGTQIKRLQVTDDGVHITADLSNLNEEQLK